MTDTLEKLLSGCDLANFVGRKTEQDAFYNWLQNIVIMKSPESQWFHITGLAGSGKSSLLEKYQEMAVIDRVLDISVVAPHFISEVTPFLEDLSNKIDLKSPEWRSFFQRKKKVPLLQIERSKIKSLEGKTFKMSDVKIAVESISGNLQSWGQKLEESNKFIGVFVDNVDNFLKMSAPGLLALFIELIRKITEVTSHIFFVTTSLIDFTEDEQFLDVIGEAKVNKVLLDTMEVSEGELLVRRVGKFDKETREEIALASSRYPFDLYLRTLLKMNSLEYLQLEKETLNQLLNIPEEIEKVLVKISQEEKNYFKRERYEDWFSAKLIDTVIKRGILTGDDTWLTVPSHSLWEMIKTYYLPTDVRTELLLIVERIGEQVESGKLPSNKDMNRIRDALASVRDFQMLFDISGQLIIYSEKALSNNLAYAAWDIFQLATFGLSKTGDIEKMAEMNETFAGEFANKGHEYYAAVAYLKAAELFKSLGSSGKVNAEANFREAGIRFRKEAESIDLAIFHYAARNLYAKSIRAFLSAGEQNSARDVRKKAQSAFNDYPLHQSYITKIGETT